MGEESYGPVEEILGTQGPSTTSGNMSIPSRFPVYDCTFTSPDSSGLGTLHSRISAPGAAAIAAPDAEHSIQAGSPDGTDTSPPMQRASDDSHPQNSTRRVGAEEVDSTHGLSKFQGSFDQIKAKDRDWGRSNVTDIGNEGWMTPITRGILEWMGETDCEFNLSWCIV